ncbi:MAG: biopolymer transporter ExbD [Deltaproteobacteria bacterium]|nr:biopolymer transporter ExbD [Deltaproteobacteria bacterium]
MGMKVGDHDDLNSEINVTPMVDVMLVLLVIFMITTPMMNSGVDLDLPQVQAQNIEDPNGKLILSIDGSHHLFLGGTPVAWKDLKVKLSANERVKKEGQIWIEADQKLAYGIVITAMAVAKDAGVAKVMMLTDPTDQLQIEDLDKATP